MAESCKDNLVSLWTLSMIKYQWDDPESICLEWRLTLLLRKHILDRCRIGFLDNQKRHDKLHARAWFSTNSNSDVTRELCQFQFYPHIYCHRLLPSHRHRLWRSASTRRPPNYVRDWLRCFINYISANWWQFTYAKLSQYVSLRKDLL